MASVVSVSEAADIVRHLEGMDADARVVLTQDEAASPFLRARVSGHDMPTGTDALIVPASKLGEALLIGEVKEEILRAAEWNSEVGEFFLDSMLSHRNLADISIRAAESIFRNGTKAEKDNAVNALLLDMNHGCGQLGSLVREEVNKSGRTPAELISNGLDEHVRKFMSDPSLFPEDADERGKPAFVALWNLLEKKSPKARAIVRKAFGRTAYEATHDRLEQYRALSRLGRTMAQEQGRQ